MSHTDISMVTANNHGDGTISIEAASSAAAASNASKKTETKIKQYLLLVQQRADQVLRLIQSGDSAHRDFVLSECIAFNDFILAKRKAHQAINPRGPCWKALKKRKNDLACEIASKETMFKPIKAALKTYFLLDDLDERLMVAVLMETSGLAELVKAVRQ